MTTITKERAEIKSFITGFLSDPAHDNQSTDSLLANVFRIAQASLEAEPVAWQVTITKDGLDSASTIYRDCAEKDTWVRMHETLGSVVHVTPLYMAPPAPVIQADVAQAIENLKQKLVECNRYNYCADAVKGVEDACCAVIYSQVDNPPASGSQAAESNRGNEWTGNPDIDNAIIMLDRIDTAESYDDDRIEAIKAVLRRLAGNYPVTPDGWISCSERMPPQDDWILIYSKHGEYMAGQVQGEYVELSDGTLSWLGNALFWMPLPEPPQEAK